MPTIDMSLDELKKYRGSSPCPEDIDIFWDEAIQEMKSIDSALEIKPAEFNPPNADCFDLTFTGVGGSRVYAKYLRPKNIDKPTPCVLLFHGYWWYSGSWYDKLSYVNMGMSVVALDVRGQAGKSDDLGGTRGSTINGHIIRGLRDGPKNLFYRKVFLDTAQLAGIVMGLPEIDENRVVATGDSQGGALTLACASLEPRIRMIAPMYPFLCDFKRVWDMDLDKGAYDELRWYFKSFDPLHEHENEIFNTLGYIDIQNLTKRIQAEVLWGIGLIDTTCPPSTQFAAYNNITSKKEMLIYPDFEHERLPGFDDKAYMFFSRIFM